jgi:uncharacterized membrane protein
MKLWPPTFAQRAIGTVVAISIFLIMFCALFGEGSYLDNLTTFFVIFMIVLALIPMAAIVAVGTGFVLTITIEYGYAFYRSRKTGRSVAECLDDNDV